MIYVYVDSSELRKIGSKPHAFLEMGYGLDQEDTVAMINDFISNDRIKLVLADRAWMYVDNDLASAAATRAAGGPYIPPKCKYDFSIQLDPPCTVTLKREMTALLEYHHSVPSQQRAFERSMQEMWQLMPLTSNPILNQY